MKKTKKYRRLKLFLAALLCLAVVAAGAIWASYNVLTVTDYQYESAKLTGSLTVVCLGDMHDHSFGKDNSELVARVAALKPDVIVITGDALNYYSESDEYLLSLVRRLSNLCQVYFTVGNHDVRFMAVNRSVGRLERVERAGAVVLNGSYADVVIRGQRLRIGGLYDYVYNQRGLPDERYRASDTYRFLAEFENTDAFKLLLTHKPGFLLDGEESARWDIDLAFCGHEHGGQMRLPLIGGVYSHLGWFSPYVDGAHLFNGVPTIVTRGLSSYLWMYNGWPAPPRMFNLPEIVRVELTGTAGE